MKRTFILLAIMFSSTSTVAQNLPLLVDKEALLTEAEQGRLDSLLKSYRKRTGNLVTFSSDTADVFSQSYKDSVGHAYASSVDEKGHSMQLLVSKNHSEIQLSSIDLGTRDKDVLVDLGKIISYGIPYLSEKKRAEGFTVICKKAMEYLDGLPLKQ